MSRTLVRVVIVCLFCVLAAGQDFSIPSTWRKPTSSLSRMSREALASAVVDSMSTRFNASTGDVQDAIYDESAYLLTAISRTDYLSGNTSYQTLVLENINVHFQRFPGIANYGAWGLAAINAHLAYKDSQSLSFAVSVWSQMVAYQIQPSDAAQGFVVAQSNVSIPSSCNGTSVAGGVFGAVGSTSTGVDAPTVAAFMALSGHLYEVTSDSKYLAAAELAAQFIQAHMVSGPIIVDNYLVGACSFDTSVGPMIWDSAFTIWGLSILANNNGAWTPFLNSLVSTTIPFAWTSASDGVIGEIMGDVPPNNDLQRSLKAIFIRGLQEAWMRADSKSDVATYIKSFLLVQFNALQDHATFPGSNLYSPSWEGPAQPTLIEWGQLCALDVLNSAFVVEPSNDPSASVPNATTPSNTQATGGTSASPVSSTSNALTPTSLTFTSNGRTFTSDGLVFTSDGQTYTSTGPIPTSDRLTPTSIVVTFTSDGQTFTSISLVPTSNGTIPTTPVSRARSNTTAIIAGAIGGILMILIVSGLLMFLRQRKTRRRKDREVHSPPVTNSDVTEPYMLSSSEISEVNRLRGGKAALSILQFSEVDSPSDIGPPTHVTVDQESAASDAEILPLPVMIAQLNRMLERFPVARSVYQEGPPSYQE